MNPVSSDRSATRPSTIIQAIPLPDFLAIEYPEPTWVVDQLMPAGVGIIAGAPKAGKSFLALDVALSVASGRDVLGLSVDRGPALYCALEGMPRDHQRRIHSVLEDSTPSEDFHTVDRLPRLGDGLEAALDEWITVTDARLIVIDTLVRVGPERAPRKTQYEQDADMLRPIEEMLRSAHPSTSVMMVHHSRETKADDPLDSICLSRGLTATVEWAWVLASNPRGRSDAVLHTAGRQAESQSLALAWNSTSLRWNHVGAAVEFAGGKTRGEILEVIRASGEPLSPKEIVVATGQNANTIRASLKRMLGDGQLTVADGRYQVAPVATAGQLVADG